ncbi:[NiFe]-hydrogenase assembly chaperone HybE [Bradyrhizobium sp. 83012]|uniref:[NiFe]-hydrogenase assembly chaperone HybE n=1 Tax=Bradyrhizobium aeschynomenes TaxID=2734909 RepID=A0ABX2CD92_9BRAD|nr:[NiFe]-hydrogenase assembly chaperone HybE [Bradyrhizobium aeschynomenes]NPU66184.1 [NiFe]-hydrogenase assembly chaperone HybE [Bradyrhizobium aeschynomenes]NPV20663.1 [NiFe]-hydrogenase assembly chaperone HybE [Bradyrhizobium aeschynomenes]
MSAGAAGQEPCELTPAAWGERLAGLYREIGTRTMRELPIYHDVLDVEAVGFTSLNGLTIGIVVTPWFMNVIVPVAEGSVGASVTLELPAGCFAFTIGDVAGVGPIASCSLFSPMFEFEDMAAARAAAKAAMAALMTAHDEEPDTEQAVTTSRAIDRRAFLRGTLSERRA